MAPARSDTAALPEALGRLHFTVEETETGGVRVTRPGSLRQQVVEVGPSPGHLTGAPAVPSLPSLPLSPSLRLHCSVLLFWDALGTSACETP